jgi:hypothetical protein
LRAAIKSRHIRVVFLSKRIANCGLPVLLSQALPAAAALESIRLDELGEMAEIKRREIDF